MQKGVPDCSPYLLRIPWIARRWVVGPCTRVLSNVSAADELQHSTEVLRLSLSELRRKLNPLARGSRGYCLQPVTGSKLQALNSAGIRARSSP